VNRPSYPDGTGAGSITRTTLREEKRTNRHDWSPAARDQFIGPEPERQDPLPSHTKAVATCRATLTDSYRLSLNAVSENETAGQLLNVLTAVEVTDAPPSARPMRVVLMGRTMAGKSTLLATLTAGSADRIGVGAQRTSLDVFAAPAVDLRDVEIVDTPGVGALDGADDVALAMAEVPGADLVLWVASNDSFQEETAQALRAVAFRGKPVVVALNCRAPLVDDLDRDDFLEDPDSVFDQHEGHFNTIRSHLSAAGVRPVAEVMLHAEAARQSRLDRDYGSELREASRLDELLASLELESRDRRTARRVLREADEVRSQAEALSQAVATVEQQTREFVHIARGMREDQERRTARLVDACRQRMEDDVIRLIGRRQGWHQNVTDFGPQVSEEWDKEQGALVADLDEALNARLTALSRAVGEATAAAEREWTTAARPNLKVGGLRDFRGLWKRKAAGIVVGGGGALAAAAVGFAVGGPIGAAIGGAGSLLVTPLRKKAQALFTSKAKILEANRELLRTKIGEVLRELESQMLSTGTDTIARVAEEVARSFARRAESEAAAFTVADVMATQQQVIESAISKLDHETVGCLLHADGRPRLAASVERVTRLPGVCTAIQATDEALTEAWLFPPSSPEVLTFGRAPSPGVLGANATSYVLGLTEEVPASIRCRPDHTVVTTNAAVPEPVLAAWSATLSDHLGTQVEIVGPSVQRSAPA
jgi:gas vesicle protein